jgi:hypothetical protein
MPLVTLDTCGSQVEVTVWPSADSGGLSVLLSAADWASIVAQGEALAPVRAYRVREARLGQSHEARASRR